MLQQNAIGAYMISSRSVTDGVSLSVIKSKLVYNSMIFVDNKPTLICLLIYSNEQQFLSFYLSGEFCIFEDKRLMQIGHMTQSMILPVTLPNIHQFQKFFHQQIK